MKMPQCLAENVRFAVNQPEKNTFFPPNKIADFISRANERGKRTRCRKSNF